MKAGLVALLFLAVVLAGCSQAKSPELAVPVTDFSDKKIEVTATTGAIRGLVVDERIVPVIGATVSLSGASDALVTTTDDQGRFVFDQLQPGTYFLGTSSPLHKSVQTAVDVVAGEDEPELTRIQVERLFKQEPFVVGIKQDGFFECTMAGPGPWYGSAMCVDYLLGPIVTGLYPAARNLTTQNREWHMNVEAGWQTIVVEIDWTPSAQATSGQLGIVVSTYKPTRNGAHSFLNYQSGPPLRTQLDIGVKHATAASVDPTTIPAEGMVDVSYFVGVRQTTGAAVALNQDFDVFIHQFYYLPAPEGWSVVNGDVPPY